MSERVLHCWTGRRDWAEETYGRDSQEFYDAWEAEIDATCFLERDHAGPHEFTPDDQVIVEFKGEKP